MISFVAAILIIVMAIIFNQRKDFSDDVRGAANILATMIVAILLVFGTINIANATSTYSHMPNTEMTPGDIASIDVQEICAKGYPARSRNVSEKLKRQVYAAYGVNKNLCKGGCKIDHLVPLSIGGSNKITNLWPHEYRAKRTVFMKTRLEVRLRKEVCRGTLNIQEAQYCIATNWPACFDRFYPRVYPK